MNKISIMAASVRKWQRIIEGKGADGGVLDCPPCRIFYVLVCTGCPIAAYSGKKFCRDTPYIPWYRHQMEAHGYIRKKVYCAECLRLATDMRDYMQEILEHLRSGQGENDISGCNENPQSSAVSRHPQRKLDRCDGVDGT